MKDVELYAIGAINISCCVLKSLTIEEVEKSVNLQSPTGISSRWAIAEEPTFKDGEPIPNQCEKFEGRHHWLLHC